MTKSDTNEVIQEWESLYAKEGGAHKNRFPDPDIIRFSLRTFPESERQGIRILDLGCGWGNNLSFLKYAGFEAWGIDGSKTACRQSRGVTKCISQGSLMHLPFPTDTFDAVVDRNSAQCNTKKDVARIIREVHRVLKPGGSLYSIILARTNEPQRFHAKYLTTPDSMLGKKDLVGLYDRFTRIEVDYSERTYDGGALEMFQWHVTAVKNHD